MNDAEKIAFSENRLVNGKVHFDNAGKFDVMLFDAGKSVSGSETWKHMAKSNSNNVELWIKYNGDYYDGANYSITVYYRKAAKDVQNACVDFVFAYNLHQRVWSSIDDVCDFLNEHKDELEELFGGVLKTNMLTASRIAKELRSIARELVAGRRRMAWRMTENGGINDQYAYIVLDGSLEYGQLIDVVPDGSELLFKCGDALKESVLEYLPERFREKARKVWSPNFLEFLPSYFAGKDCVGYPIAQLGVTMAEIEQARKDEEAGIEYYDEEEKMSEREKNDRALNQRIESLTREIEQKSRNIQDLGDEIIRYVDNGIKSDRKIDDYEHRLNELNKKISELEKLTGDTYSMKDFGVDTSMLEQDEWDF